MSLWRLIRSVPSWLFPLTVGLLVLFLPEFGLDFALSRQVQLACILALVVSGLNLSLGYAGELALGQAAMYAAGAYTAGLMSIAGYTDIVLQLIASGLVALAVGIVTGIPGLRLGSWSLAMTSFFLVLLVPDIIAVFGDTTGGRNGLSGIEPATLFGEVVDADRFYMVVVIVAILWFTVMRNLVVSRHGIAFRTLKQSPVLASSVGISVFRMKLLGYAIGAFPAGLAGALFANIDMYVSPEAFGFTFATAVLAACILGGATSVYGAAIGAAIMQLGPNQSSEFQQYALVFYGGFLILGGVLLSGGLAKVAKQAAARLDRAAGLTGTRTGTRHADTGRSAMEPMSGRTLVVDGISKAFGGNQALDNASLRAEPGSITALIGPNGSGKTTMLNMICGFYRPDSGRILIGDNEVQGRAPEQVARCGVARTFQTPDIPDGVTVLEAVASGRYSTDRVSMLSTVLRLPRHHKIRVATSPRRNAHSTSWGCRICATRPPPHCPWECGATRGRPVGGREATASPARRGCVRPRRGRSGTACRPDPATRRCRMHDRAGRAQFPLGTRTRRHHRRARPGTRHRGGCAVRDRTRPSRTQRIPRRSRRRHGTGRRGDLMSEQTTKPLLSLRNVQSGYATSGWCGTSRSTCGPARSPRCSGGTAQGRPAPCVPSRD